jgi:hypothetical protein
VTTQQLSFAATTGANNTASGNSALFSNTTGSNNVALEVARVNPALVLPDKEGKPYTVPTTK